MIMSCLACTLTSNPPPPPKKLSNDQELELYEELLYKGKEWDNAEAAAWVQEEWGIDISTCIVSGVFNGYGGGWHAPQTRHPACMFPEVIAKYTLFEAERNEFRDNGIPQITFDESAIQGEKKVRAVKGGTSHCASGSANKHSISEKHNYKDPKRKLSTQFHGESGLGENGDAILLTGETTVREQKATVNTGKVADVYCALAQLGDNAMEVVTEVFDTTGTGEKFTQKERLWRFFFEKGGVIDQARKLFPTKDYPNKVIWLDNLGSYRNTGHHDPEFVSKVEQSGEFHVRYFAPYHSWSNPTEYAFRCLKGLLRKHRARGIYNISPVIEEWQFKMGEDDRVHGMFRQADWFSYTD